MLISVYNWRIKENKHIKVIYPIILILHKNKQIYHPFVIEDTAACLWYAALAASFWISNVIPFLWYRKCTNTQVDSSATLMLLARTTVINGKVLVGFEQIPLDNPGTTGPNIRIFVLVFMYFPCWFKIWT